MDIIEMVALRDMTSPARSLLGRPLWLAALLTASGLAQAEGSWQFGLSEGETHTQPLFEYDNNYNAAATGLQPENRPLYVDLLNDNEVINISLCGTADGDDIRIEIWDEAGTTQLNTTFTATTGNVSCSDSFAGTLATPYQFTPGAAGTYQLRLFNDTGNGANGVFRRFDVTVTANAAATVTPAANQGRLWATRWAFRCLAGNVCFTDPYSTSTDLYAVVSGGFANSYYVWQLNLDSFAGYAYEITANSIGLDSPNPDGTVVAALSACIDSDAPAGGCPNVSGNRNSVAAVYPIYTSDPALPYPRPTEPPRITNFRFLDDAGVDDSISPNDTITIQDTGNFLFTTNLVTEGTYSVIIDVSSDGVYGAGDVVLTGIASPGNNSVNWNGMDNSGATIPNGSYNAQVQLKTGEFHFTAADAETSGGNAAAGLTINAVLDDGSVDTSNLVYWDDATVLGLTGANAYNADGAVRFHNWGNFTSGGDGNRAYIDTYVVGAFAEPVLTRLEVEPIPSSDAPKTPLTGTIFEDLDGDGVRDPGEPGLANVVVAITEQGSGETFYVTTDANGVYTAFTNDTAVTTDVDETTLPAGYTRSAGTDLDLVNVTPGVTNDLGSDGFRATLGPVSGQVRLDTDGNGDLTDPDTGLAGVTVELYTDPNGDGDPSDGVLVTAVTSATDGSYSFIDVPLGDYVVVENDPAGHTSSGESDGSSDNRVAITRVASTPVTDVIFLDTQTGSAILIDARAICVQDAPWVEWDITPVNFTPGNLATIEWIDSDGNVVRTDTDQPLSGGRLLWPEAAVDGSGNGVSWPGWAFSGGEWVEIPTTVRPQVTLRISVNPTSQVVLSYPPATELCASGPLAALSPTAGSLPSRNGPMAVPLLAPPALLLLIALMALAGAGANRFLFGGGRPR
jgi:SdrD B-like domain